MFLLHHVVSRCINAVCAQLHYIRCSTCLTHILTFCKSASHLQYKYRRFRLSRTVKGFFSLEPLLNTTSWHNDRKTENIWKAMENMFLKKTNQDQQKYLKTQSPHPISFGVPVPCCWCSVFLPFWLPLFAFGRCCTLLVVMPLNGILGCFGLFCVDCLGLLKGTLKNDFRFS